jgi:Ca2+/H+ antiporter, TMEM165/GDT1 family
VDGQDLSVVLTSLLASGVECVEALTIVLAMGTTRGWRSALAGTVAAVAVLAVLTAVGGYALQQTFPEHTLQLVIGVLLLAFGLQWLRKAVLRAAGLKALHDEDATFREQTEAARAAGEDRRWGLDWVGFAISFKGVLLEGVEVVFIVVGFGVNAGSVPLAAAGALLGAAIVVAAGFALHRPLARAPENTLKFAVGLMLTTFGTFWTVEGLGGEWPGGDAILPLLLALWGALSWAAVRALAAWRPHERRS